MPTLAGITKYRMTENRQTRKAVLRQFTNLGRISDPIVIRQANGIRKRNTTWPVIVTRYFSRKTAHKTIIV